MLPIKIVLVDTTGTIPADTMAAAAAALNVQVTGVRRYRRPATPQLVGARKAYRTNLAAAAGFRARHYI
jgi:hypothetical protein